MKGFNSLCEALSAREDHKLFQQINLTQPMPEEFLCDENESHIATVD